MTYWADKRSPETVEKSVRNASCYGIFLDDVNKLVGFARVISDYATTFYLADVIIDSEYQRQGLGTALVSYVFVPAGIPGTSRHPAHEECPWVIQEVWL